MAYLIHILDKDNQTNSTVCKTDKDLSRFLSHLDEERFKVFNIQMIGEFCNCNKEFIKKDINLEIGKK